jgi:hypothetical protein
MLSPAARRRHPFSQMFGTGFGRETRKILDSRPLLSTQPIANKLFQRDEGGRRLAEDEARPEWFRTSRRGSASPADEPHDSPPTHTGEWRLVWRPKDAQARAPAPAKDPLRSRTAPQPAAHGRGACAHAATAARPPTLSPTAPPRLADATAPPPGALASGRAPASGRAAAPPRDALRPPRPPPLRLTADVLRRATGYSEFT